ncbi:MAG: Holliday junction resolvase RuvX [Bacteroidia bacterium]
MARILAFDYGTKRVGMAATDPGQLIASGLDTLHSKDVIPFLQHYLKEEQVEAFVVGEPHQADGSPAEAEQHILPFINRLKKVFPEIPVYREDESFTSRRAVEAMVEGGMKRKKRREKERVDQISAVLILQTFLEKKRFKTGMNF